MSLQLILLQLSEGMLSTIWIFVLTLLFSLPLGLVIAFGRMSRNVILRNITRIYISIMRGTPLMLQLLVVYFGPYYIFASMPKGQYEAAKVLGYSRMQTFFTIILPQVIKRILPSVTNEVITLVKDTSLAFSIAYAEMFTQAKALAASQKSMVPFVAAAVFYYIFNFVVAAIMEFFEKKMAYYQ